MKNRKALFAILLASCTSQYLCAQDAPPVNTNDILSTLKTIKQKQSDGVKTDQLKLAQQFLSVSQSPSSCVDYYEEAVRATQFQGQKNENMGFMEWKKKQDGQLHSNDFRNALHFHLVYLSLTLRHSAGVDMKNLLPDLVNYAEQVSANADALNGQAEIMKQPLSNSIFVRWQQIGNYVADTKSWEAIPFNVDGIYQKSILPEYRKEKDQRAIQYWDTKIQREGDNAAASRRVFDMDRFNQTTKPRLLWARSQEMLIFGYKNRAITDMVGLIKTYPYHPDATVWIAAVEELLKPGSSSGSATVPGANEAPAEPSSPQAGAPADAPPDNTPAPQN